MNPQAEYEQLLVELKAFWQQLPDKPEETPDAALRALWLTAADAPVSVAAAAASSTRALPPLAAAQHARLRSLIDSKRNGAPLAHLTGRQNFMGLEFLAGPGALIPRKETEILATVAIDKIRATLAAKGSARVIDLCTGSGNLPLAYAYHAPGCTVFAADLSEDAVALARRNADHLGLAGRVDFRAGDLAAPFDTPDFHGTVDVLTCNPPYISSAKVPAMHPEISGHEPRLAFDGGPFGIKILSRLLQDAPRFLCKGGWLGFELGLGQGPGMAKRLASVPGFTNLETHTDPAGEIRALFAQWTG